MMASAMNPDRKRQGRGEGAREPGPRDLDRRRFLALGLALGSLAGSGAWPRRAGADSVRAMPHGAGAEPAQPASGSTAGYRAEIAILFGLLGTSMSGTVTKEVDRAAGRYRVTIRGSGERGTSQIDAKGAIREGRFAPVSLKSEHVLLGRDSRLEVDYDYERRRVHYHAIWHTLLLGRRREAEQVLRMPAEQPLDDAVSVTLNFMADTLARDPDSTYHTLVVRRVRPEDEEGEGVPPGGYRAEIVPFRFRVVVDAATGQLAAVMDFSRWSSWARADSPARVLFRADRRPLSLESRLVLGGSIKVRLE
jgi:hypothetical protein